MYLLTVALHASTLTNQLRSPKTGSHKNQVKPPKRATDVSRQAQTQHLIMLTHAFQPQAPGLSYPTAAPNNNNFTHWHPERAQQQNQPRTILPQHVHFYNALFISICSFL